MFGSRVISHKSKLFLTIFQLWKLYLYPLFNLLSNNFELVGPRLLRKHGPTLDIQYFYFNFIVFTFHNVWYVVKSSPICALYWSEGMIIGSAKWLLIFEPFPFKIISIILSILLRVRQAYAMHCSVLLLLIFHFVVFNLLSDVYWTSICKHFQSSIVKSRNVYPQVWWCNFSKFHVQIVCDVIRSQC